ncbi:hypothetical protein Cni_G00404 [Canna indica]|uniref:Uncharacterized protein n=1 Tax=Canna indica TaxID=4628 RepID=A0AAQ3JL22_9LILI|nr:hypothetical protein Cni_G00404 [Canna indica]
MQIFTIVRTHGNPMWFTVNLRSGCVVTNSTAFLHKLLLNYFLVRKEQMIRRGAEALIDLPNGQVLVCSLNERLLNSCLVGNNVYYLAGRKTSSCNTCYTILCISNKF